MSQENNSSAAEQSLSPFGKFPERIELGGGLILDFFQPEDSSALEEIARSDPNIAKYIPWAKEDKQKYIARTTKARSSRGPRYAVRLDGGLVGHIAVFTCPDIPDTTEMGYVLAPHARGKQIIDKILPILEGLIQEYIPSSRPALCINDDNLPSQRVAERLGYLPSTDLSDGDRMYYKKEE